MANYWRENFDLSYIVERDWDTLREKLNGKMHVYCGTMDNFYLNNAVYMFEARVNALVAAEDDNGAFFGPAQLTARSTFTLAAVAAATSTWQQARLESSLCGM